MYTYFLTNPPTKIPDFPHNPIVRLVAFEADMLLSRAPKLAWGMISFRDEPSREEKEEYRLFEGALLGHPAPVQGPAA